MGKRSKSVQLEKKPMMLTGFGLIENPEVK